MRALNSTPGSCLQARCVPWAAPVRCLGQVVLPISQLRKPRVPQESGVSRWLCSGFAQEKTGMTGSRAHTFWGFSTT